jgi:hypothetical protein
LYPVPVMSSSWRIALTTARGFFCCISCHSGNQQRTALGWSQVELIDQQALYRPMFPSFSRQLTGTLDLF